MKLHIKRDQAEQKGLLGGTKGFSFSLACRLELNDAEKSLIEKYKQWDMPVHTYELERGGQATWSLRDIAQGKTVTCAGVPALLQSEEEIKEACNNVKVLLEVMESFGGEEVIDI